MDDTIALLLQQAIFGGLKRETISLILEQSPPLTYASGQFLFHEGDPADAVYVVESGIVAVLRQAGDQYYLLRRLNTGDCLGEMALIDMQTRSASGYCETECSIIRIDINTFYEIYRRDPEQYTLMQMNMAREVCRRLRNDEALLFQLGINGKLPEAYPAYSLPKNKLPPLKAG